ncbi:hypothetical protein B9Z19DRAFT_717459 [Tuber borchii]|uniref:Uncharacterized protein n=1 Tax=Tuber borchii TaxID=42251 RepID=A0A2T6ZYM5_TUBBO|nr:hypothetical protein B9Z19DRAFT_717459 [Tuber borchii]
MLSPSWITPDSCSPSFYPRIPVPQPTVFTPLLKTTVEIVQTTYRRVFHCFAESLFSRNLPPANPASSPLLYTALQSMGRAPLSSNRVEPPLPLPEPRTKIFTPVALPKVVAYYHNSIRMSPKAGERLLPHSGCFPPSRNLLKNHTNGCGPRKHWETLRE